MKYETFMRLVKTLGTSAARGKTLVLVYLMTTKEFHIQGETLSAGGS